MYTKMGLVVALMFGVIAVMIPLLGLAPDV
jgi:hypothetical protein